MPSRISLSLVAAAALLFATEPAQAQEASTISPAALDASIAAQPGDARAVLGTALSSTRARTAARALGLDADEIEARIAALDDADANRLADRVLAGGDSITISVTALIIILLVLILITD